MCRKLFLLTSFVLLLSLVLGSAAVAGPLIGWWKFDEGSGTVARDSSGLGNDGIFGPEGTPKWVAGTKGGAIELDGNDDYININAIANDMPTNNNFTVSAWMKTTMTGDGNVIGSNDTGTNHDFIFGVDQNVLLVEADSVRRYPPTINDGQWHMISYVRDGGTAYAYTDGVLVGTETPSGNPVGQARWSIGMEWDSDPSDEYQGLVDDVRFYNVPLPAYLIADLFKGIEPAFVKAEDPVPADGATHAETWVSLGWTAGDRAVSHDVYFSDNRDDVANGAAAAFRGNQALALNFFIAGLGLPGDPYPNGLTPGTAYYWRVDEVEANGTTKNQGPVWSFSVPPRTAYNPGPPDGAYFTDLTTKLSWTGGFGAKLHYVHFGSKFEDVNNATTGGVPMGTTTFTPPGPLVLNKTYYWRVDEFDGAARYKGNVWSFTTTLTGLGTAVMERWENISGTALSGLKSDPRYPNNPTVTETVTRFAWDGPDTDNYGGRISGWLYIPATGDYTFWLNTDDSGELWLSTDDDPANVRVIALETGYTSLNVWNSGEEKSQPIRLIAGQKYYIMALWKEGGGGDHCQVAWQGPGISTRTIIPGANLSAQPFSAYGAQPANEATGVTQSPNLRWKPGLEAASHELYFGTDAGAVKNATKTSPEYKGTKALGAESYSPGALAWATNYYWRVDEVNNASTASPWVGGLWSFTTADFAVIDNFEGYTDNDAAKEAIWQTWSDGFLTPTTNGALVGNEFPPYAERTIVHGDRQSMPLSYNNATTARNSEASLVLTHSRDWTVEGVTALSLWYYGNSANVSERMYVSIANRTGAPAIVYNDVTNATTMDAWRRWVIPLQDFAGQGINLRDVDRIVIGFGTKGSTAPGGTGRMYIDDIGLYRSASEPEEILLEAEAGTITAPLTVRSDPLASGGGCIGTNDGIGDETTSPPATGVAAYNFTVLGGVYKIALRVSIAGGSNSFWVRIPGATNYDPGTDPLNSGWIRFNDISDGAAWHWDEVHSNDHGNQVVKITLPAGAHTLEVARREDGALLDAIVIMAVE
jgi:hypothetical protein